MIDLFDLRGKKALICGGARGIGFSCAKALAMCGADIILADCLSIEMEDSAEVLSSYNVRTETIRCDVSDRDSVEAMASNVDRSGGIDIFINSAAVTNRKQILDMTDDEWLRIINTNLNGAFYLGRAIGKSMIKHDKGGRIIYIVSTGAYRAGINFGAYSASKAGVVMLMKTLALELAPYGILCNAIAPTATDTKFTSDYYQLNPEKKEAVIKNHPLGRLAIADDYMGAAAYLSSAASSFVTGTVLVVDGGKTAK